MTWDPEKYREKREKVLGVKKRGISFGSLAAVVSCLMLMGFASVWVPGAGSYIKTRHLDDAIYKLEGSTAWPQSLLTELSGLPGVRGMEKDTHGARLVLTYDRRVTSVHNLAEFFQKNETDVSLLNRISHRQRRATIEAEKEPEGETL